jgi:hypothetical protein
LLAAFRLFFFWNTRAKTVIAVLIDQQKNDLINLLAEQAT